MDNSFLHRKKLLLVDDEPLVLIGMQGMLNWAALGYEVVGTARNGAEALRAVQEKQPDIVVSDIRMPVMDGFAVLSEMNRSHWIEDIPVIMISSEDADTVVRRAYELGVSDYVSRPFDAGVVYRRVFNTIKLYAKQRPLISLVTSQIREKEKNTQMLISILSEAVEFRNGESGLHVQHIQRLTERVLEKLLERPNRSHITSEMQDNIPLAAALHDIGKINIPESILNKPGKLTREEFYSLVEILKKSKLMKSSKNMRGRSAGKKR